MAFYHAAKPSPRFQAAKPFHKFLSVKLIVFFSFWQYLALDFGARVGLVRGRSEYDTDEMEVAFADFLICIEMALAALAHAWVFSHREHTYGFYQLRNQDDAGEGVVEAELNVSGALEDMFNVKDVVEDFHSSAIHARQSGRKFREKTLGGGLMDAAMEMGIEMVDMGTVVNSNDGLSDSEEQTLLGGGGGERGGERGGEGGERGGERGGEGGGERGGEMLGDEPGSEGDPVEPVVEEDVGVGGRLRAGSMLDQASETVDQDFGDVRGWG